VIAASAEALAVLAVGLIAYTYALYPIIIAAISAVKASRRRTVPNAEPREWPRVSLIISAHNEEAVIGARIKNAQRLRYPFDKLEILIGSDGSTDRTDAVVRGFEDPRVRLVVAKEWRGKPAMLNRLVAQARGEILLFSDANSEWAPDAAEQLVRRFEDPRVGAVCGKLRLRARDGRCGRPERTYWQYETVLKTLEGGLGCALGANGAIYAMRRELFRPLDENTLVDDFVAAMRVKEQGFDVVFAPEAVAEEEPAASCEGEYVRRVRIGAGNFQSIRILRGLLDPRRGVVALAFFSHKVVRWCVPFLLAALFAANVFLLDHLFWRLAFAAQLALYGTAAAAQAIPAFRRLGLVEIAHYFVLMNLAYVVGFARQMRGAQPVTWRRGRAPEPVPAHGAPAPAPVLPATRAFVPPVAADAPVIRRGAVVVR
jgi:cellulose synthase/poly-beta-1,6-N-acetylglucosamine synthase-like glycosyltransferase